MLIQQKRLIQPIYIYLLKDNLFSKGRFLGVAVQFLELYKNVLEAEWVLYANVYITVISQEHVVKQLSGV